MYLTTYVVDSQHRFISNSHIFSIVVCYISNVIRDSDTVTMRVAI